MTIKIEDILKNRILPFEVESEKLRRLFSFYLHSAPTIESKSAAQIDNDRLKRNWICFRELFPNNTMTFFSSSYANDKFIKSFEKYNIHNDAHINRKIKVSVCKKKDTKESEYQCLLRHLRNSIAHDNVYLLNAGNRKYILFEDYSNKENISARILFSQADLSALKKEIMK